MDKLIESSNFLVLIVGLYVAWNALLWYRRAELTIYTKEVVASLMWVFSSVCINRGWFAMSRQLAGTGETWHSTMFEIRPFIVFATALMASWGMLQFVRLINETTMLQEVRVFALSFILAFGLGYY